MNGLPANLGEAATKFVLQDFFLFSARGAWDTENSAYLYWIRFAKLNYADKLFLLRMFLVLLVLFFYIFAHFH